MLREGEGTHSMGKECVGVGLTRAFLVCEGDTVVWGDKSTLHLWGWEEQDTHENPTYTTAWKSVQFINGFPPNDA